MRRTLLILLMASVTAGPLAAQASEGPGNRRQAAEALRERAQAQPRPQPQRQAPPSVRPAPRPDVQRAEPNRGERPSAQRPSPPQNWQGRPQDQRPGRDGWDRNQPRPGPAVSPPRRDDRDRAESARERRQEVERRQRAERAEQQRARQEQLERQRRIDRHADRDWRDDRRNDRNWSRDWRGDRGSWDSWRSRNSDRFRSPPRYNAPRGYSYSRWYPGTRINSGFYDRSYWISDPGYYNLPRATGNYRWVRYFNDVLLVNVRTGQVADIVYDFFW